MTEMERDYGNGYKGEDRDLRSKSGLSAGLCGCGRAGRYSTKDGIACNKYMRCPTYDELSDTLQMANNLLRAYRAKREVDGLNGRKWDASAHFEAEAMIEKLER